MDERRFRTALDTITETIEGYGEETIFGALGVIADRFGWELAKRDPGPACEYDDFYDRIGVMAPLHVCPHDAPDTWEQREMHLRPGGESDAALVHRAFGLARAKLDEFGMPDTHLGLLGR